MNSSDPQRPFPARVPPLPGESLTSLVRRTAQAMGYENVIRVMTLLREQGQLPAHPNQLAPGRVANYLAALLRQSPEIIFSLTVHACAPSLVLVSKDRQPAELCDSKTILRYFSSSWPVCPACLAQDEVSYERLVWSFRPMPMCIKHGCVLIFRCPACQRPLCWDRLDVLRCRCGQRLDIVKPLAISSHAMSLCRTINDALHGKSQLLPDTSVSACFWWMDRMVAAMQKTPDWLAETRERMGLSSVSHEETIAWLAAAEVFHCHDWPERFIAFLDVFQRVDKYKFTSTGVGRRFGMFLRHAMKLEELGWPIPADTLRKYLVEHYTAGHLDGKVCLFRKPKDRAALKDRQWITQTMATKMLGLRHGAVAQLIQEGILTGQVHPAGQNGRSVGLVRRDTVEKLQADLQDALNVRAVAKRLGIDHHRVLDLVHGKIFPLAVRTAKGWLIPQAAVADMENFYHRFPTGKPESSGWLSLHQATRDFGPTGLTLAMLIEMIREEKVSVRMADPSKRLNGIVVSHADLVALVPEIRTRREQKHGYFVHDVGKVLFDGRPIKVSVIKKWITAGLLNARKAGRARIVSPAEINRFRQEYCLTQEACQILGITRTTLYRWEVEGRVKPVYGKRVTSGAGFSLYLRADLAGLSRRRAA